MSLRTARKCYVKGVPQLQEISAMLQETLNARGIRILEEASASNYVLSFIRYSRERVGNSRC